MNVEQEAFAATVTMATEDLVDLMNRHDWSPELWRSSHQPALAAILNG